MRHGTKRGEAYGRAKSSTLVSGQDREEARRRVASRCSGCVVDADQWASVGGTGGGAESVVMTVVYLWATRICRRGYCGWLCARIVRTVESRAERGDVSGSGTVVVVRCRKGCKAQ